MIPGHIEALRKDPFVGQVLVVLFNGSFKEPDKRIKPQENTHELNNKKIKPVILTNVHFFVSNNITDLTLPYTFRIHEHQVHKREWQYEAPVIDNPHTTH